MGIHIEEMLDAVAVVVCASADLSKHRTQPNRSDTKSLEVAQLILPAKRGGVVAAISGKLRKVDFAKAAFYL
jgi:hypothetical protein